MTSRDQTMEKGSSGLALIVEDEPAFAHYIKDLLSKTDRLWVSETFHEGKEALTFLKKGGRIPNIALVDLGLPDISGVDVIRHIHQTLPEVPILVISVLSNEKSLLDAIRAGARGYVLKEDREETLIESLNEFLKGNYPISAGLAHHLFKLAGKDERPKDIGSFSRRELEVLNCIAQGMSYAEVGEALNIGLNTVQSYIRSLYRKLDAHSQVQAVSAAQKRGLIRI